MKIVFLNIDGTINSGDSLQSRYELWKLENPDYASYTEKDRSKLIDHKYMDEYGELFDERAIRWLAFILKKTKARLVITGERKMDKPLKKIWQKRLLPGQIYDTTPNININNPEIEIDHWIKHMDSPERFVILDPLHAYEKFADNQIEIDKYQGITGYVAEEAIRILNSRNKANTSFDFSIGELD